MNYLTIIDQIAKQNRYTQLYCSIISRAKSRASTKKEAMSILEHVEKHHILPKSFKMGGDKDNDNIAYLTPREHFLVHKLLVKMFTDEKLIRKMRYAFVCFAMNKSGNRIIKSRDYEKIRIEIKELNQMNRPWCVGRESPFKGKTHTEEVRAGISAKKKGKVSPRKNAILSDDTKLKISIANKGKSHAPTYGMLGKTTTEEAKAKQREYKWYNNGTISKKIKPEQLDSYPGFTAGRLVPVRSHSGQS